MVAPQYLTISLLLSSVTTMRRWLTLSNGRLKARLSLLKLVSYLCLYILAELSLGKTHAASPKALDDTRHEQSLLMPFNTFAVSINVSFGSGVTSFIIPILYSYLFSCLFLGNRLRYDYY